MRRRKLGSLLLSQLATFPDGLTAGEFAKICDQDVRNPSAGLSSLVAKGVAVKVERRICTVTGQMRWVYVANGRDLPRQSNTIRRRRRREAFQVATLQEKVEALQEELRVKSLVIEKDAEMIKFLNELNATLVHPKQLETRLFIGKIQRVIDERRDTKCYPAIENGEHDDHPLFWVFHELVHFFDGFELLRMLQEVRSRSGELAGPVPAFCNCQNRSDGDVNG